MSVDQIMNKSKKEVNHLLTSNQIKLVREVFSTYLELGETSAKAGKRLNAIFEVIIMCEKKD